MRSSDFITRAIRRTTLALCCALVLGACTSWIETPSPAPSVLNEIRGPILVARPDGSSVVLREAYVTGDTLYGYHARTRIAAPLRDVKTTHRREFDPARSIAALVVGAMTAYGAFVAALSYAYGNA